MLRHSLSALTATLAALALSACADVGRDRVLGPDPLDLITPGTIESVSIAAAGNLARCSTQRDDETAKWLDLVRGTFFALGDNALPDGSLQAYLDCYEPSWGRHKARTYAVLGNHEYDTGSPDGTFDYFGTRAGPRGQGYYSFDLGSWHVVVINDNAAFVPYAAGSEQDLWLQADLAANTKKCTLAMWHAPRFLSSNFEGFIERPTRKILWDRLYAAGADVVLNAQEHHYERMAPMQPDGTRDDATGIRQFLAGTGGESPPAALPTVAVHPNSEVRASVTGVLQLTLGDGGYTWSFLPLPGDPFTDAGSGLCH